MKGYSMSGKLFPLTLVLFCLVSLSVDSQEPVEVNRESGEAYSAGVKRYSAGQYASADSLFRSAIKLDERNIAASFALGLSLNKQRRFEEASAQFRTVIEADPGHTKAWQALPLALRDSGKIDEAIAAYDQAMTRFPNELVFPLGKARLLMRQQDFAGAAAVLAVAAETDPDNPSVQQALGYTYLPVG